MNLSSMQQGYSLDTTADNSLIAEDQNTSKLVRSPFQKPSSNKLFAKKQEGLSGWAILIIIIMIGGYAIVFFKFFPVYMDHFAIKRVLSNIEEEIDTLKKSKKEIKLTIMKRMSMNSITTMVRDDIKISKKKSILTVRIEYEVRVPLFGHMDGIVHFNDHIEANVGAD
ncbi:MAG: DUF4845 domain-containing protein [Pseudomonadales bacterium]|nr:DUF4845 domain-containing protein [Pseudomonadales bacterium]